MRFYGTHRIGRALGGFRVKFAGACTIGKILNTNNSDGINRYTAENRELCEFTECMVFPVTWYLENIDQTGSGQPHAAVVKQPGMRCANEHV